MSENKNRVRVAMAREFHERLPFIHSLIYKMVEKSEAENFMIIDDVNCEFAGIGFDELDLAIVRWDLGIE